MQLSSPANDEVISTTSVTLAWQKYESYTTYYGELIREPLYENEAVYTTIKGTIQTISGLVMDGSTYCWRIGISSNLTSSSWSNYRFFRCATTVPYVVSMDRIEAAEKIIKNKLQLGTETEEYNNVVPINRVIRQEPAASTVVDPETKVNLFISKGPTPAEGEGEDIETGATCTGCTDAKSFTGLLGDWLLVGIALMGLAATKHF